MGTERLAALATVEAHDNTPALGGALADVISAPAVWALGTLKLYDLHITSPGLALGAVSSWRHSAAVRSPGAAIA